MIRTERPYHRYAGTSKQRQQVGDPGHCERRLSVGHVAAHPSLRCADVGCYFHHDEMKETAARAQLGPVFRRRFRRSK